ncbi:TPA: helix-turn-helix domain-containing protein, partial [Streptococcus suis]
MVVIKNNLANILKTKEKTAAWLSVKTGITPAALSKIVNNSSTKIDYITLNKI